MSDSLMPATHGAGPLLQRDYWAVLAECPLRPSGVMAHVKAHFCELPPAALVEFVAASGMGCNAELEIKIKPGQQCRVRVLHEDAQSLTLGTLAGHPEAGRITFGAYRNPESDVIFHIRSRARSANSVKLIGFMAIGEAMQTNTWTDFINNVAASVGARIDGPIHAETQRVDELPEDDQTPPAPTFTAAGD
jgi:uncharacterized protein (UPF0548 family)